MRSRSAAVAFLLAALAAPPAVTADAPQRDDRGAPTSASDAARRALKQDKRSDARVGDDLVSCKRDADGKRGPERSRFMTQCLKERK